jgi:hypothetical protein
LTGGFVTKEANATIVESNIAMLYTEAIDSVAIATNVIMFAFAQSHHGEITKSGYRKNCTVLCPAPAQDGGAATRDDSPRAGQVPFF